MPGLTYLVYAYGTAPGDLWVGMCSPGGWVSNTRVATNLRYLRNERPTAGDLAPLDLRTSRRYWEEMNGRWVAASGKICGTVSSENPKDLGDGTVSFLSTQGYSPFDIPTGSAPDRKPGTAAYYPGVADRASATAVQVGAGQTRSNIQFRVPPQAAYSVRGFVSTNDKSGLTANSVSVVLLPSDGPRRGSYRQTIDFRGSFPFPKVKYFSFAEVPPGRYVAYVDVAGQGWYTKKVDVSVTTHMKLLYLELVHKK